MTAPIMVKDVDDIDSWNKADPGFLLAAGQRVKEWPGLAAEKHPSGIIFYSEIDGDLWPRRKTKG